MTSDHFYGSPVPVTNAAKRARYGSTYSLSVGALDVQPGRCTVKELFNLGVSLLRAGQLRLGQFLYEFDPSKGKEWIHMSNDPEIILVPSELKQLPVRTRIGYTLNGGRSYSALAGSEFLT